MRFFTSSPLAATEVAIRSPVMPFLKSFITESLSYWSIPDYYNNYQLFNNNVRLTLLKKQHNENLLNFYLHAKPYKDSYYPSDLLEGDQHVPVYLRKPKSNLALDTVRATLIV